MLSNIVGLGAAGLLLLFLEMFLPGMIAGIIGAILLIVSVSMSYDAYGAEGGNIALIIALVASGTLWWWWANHFQNTRFGRRMTLHASVEGNSVAAKLPDLIGLEGSAITTLRPSGTVLIGGRKVDAISEGDFIEPGTLVKVIRHAGIVVIVRRIP
jgi:membrane-bound serine protease (ClpP class)